MDVKVTCACIKGGQARENRPHTQMEDLLAGFWSCPKEAGVAGNSSCLPCGKCSPGEQEGSDWLGSMSHRAQAKDPFRDGKENMRTLGSSGSWDQSASTPEFQSFLFSDLYTPWLKNDSA